MNLSIANRMFAYYSKTDKIRHGYQIFYDKVFTDYPEPILLIEIGVWEGESLKMWSEIFPKCKIIGIDINEECKRYEDFEIYPNVFIEIFDIKDRYKWDEFCQRHKIDQNIDILIDDGSHNNFDQNQAMEYAFPRLKAGGWYIIEDLHTAYYDDETWNNPNCRNIIEIVGDAINAVNRYGYYEFNCEGTVDEFLMRKSIVGLKKGKK